MCDGKGHIQHGIHQIHGVVMETAGKHGIRTEGNMRITDSVVAHLGTDTMDTMFSAEAARNWALTVAEIKDNEFRAFLEDTLRMADSVNPSESARKALVVLEGRLRSKLGELG